MIFGTEIIGAIIVGIGANRMKNKKIHKYGVFIDIVEKIDKYGICNQCGRLLENPYDHQSCMEITKEKLCQVQ